jgi:hypothetical protein
MAAGSAGAEKKGLCSVSMEYTRLHGMAECIALCNAIGMARSCRHST